MKFIMCYNETQMDKLFSMITDLLKSLYLATQRLPLTKISVFPSESIWPLLQLAKNLIFRFYGN